MIIIKFISIDSLKNSINYFKNQNYISADHLGLFFYFKSIGFERYNYKNYKKVGNQSDEEKEFHINSLYRLSAIFDKNELGDKRTCLFPFSISEEIKHKDFFNGGSKFANLISRSRDTMDNTLIDSYLTKKDEYEFRFANDYIDIIFDEFLNNNKISVVYMATWLNRFTSIENDNKDDYELTSILIKDMKDFLNLTETEFDRLFDMDLNDNIINFNNERITGEKLRNLLNFEEEPIINSSESKNYQIEDYYISNEKVGELMSSESNNPSNNEIKDILMKTKQIILYGVPGVGKSRFIDLIEDEFDSIKKIQFHANYTYEDFIGGTTLGEDETLVNEAGVFLKFLSKAKNDENNKYLFVIDEINRGNLSKVLGETILALDRNYTVELSKKYIIDDKEISSFNIPDNFYIIGTMNSADRSIAMVDYAIRRRFKFIKLVPDYEVINNISNLNDINIDIGKLFKSLNNNILKVLDDENMLLGHSYFIPEWVDKDSKGLRKWDSKSLRYLFNYSIIPQLEEYTQGDINSLIQLVGENLASRIYNDDKFISSLIDNFPEAKLN